MKKLVLISCYMGALPPYFPAFLTSCSWNPAIDFVIFVDSDVSIQVPSNVRIEYMTLTRITSIAKEKIGKWITLDTPYKLCDFKPTYGLLFSEWISGYDYWGHCDIDVIWGQLQKKVLPLLDKKADRYFKYGHLSIYKNETWINESFKLPYSGIQYKKALSTPVSCGFDEMKGTWVLAQENGLNVYHEDIVFDIKRPGFSRYLQSYTSKNYPYQYFLCKDRCVLQFFRDESGVWKSEERAYIHFQKRKLKINVDIERSNFQITEDKIVGITMSDSVDLLLSRNQVKDIGILMAFHYCLSDFFATLRFKMLKLSILWTSRIILRKTNS